jgi:hypothetical protein
MAIVGESSWREVNLLSSVRRTEKAGEHRLQLQAAGVPEIQAAGVPETNAWRLTPG